MQLLCGKQISETPAPDKQRFWEGYQLQVNHEESEMGTCHLRSLLPVMDDTCHQNEGSMLKGITATRRDSTEAGNDLHR